MKIHIFTTGGTIDKIYFDASSEFRIGDPQVGEVLHEANVSFEYEVTQLMRKDSLDLTDADRAQIVAAVAASPCRHILVTHGTDTMVETGRRLREVAAKVIVMTGSMQPARFRTTDAIFNIASAIVAVQVLAPGVYIAMNGSVFEAHKVRKNRERRRFEPLEH